MKESINAAALRDDAGWRGRGPVASRPDQSSTSAIFSDFDKQNLSNMPNGDVSVFRFHPKNYRAFTLSAEAVSLDDRLVCSHARPRRRSAQLRRRRSADVILCSADPPSTAADNTDLSHVMKHYLKQLLLFR